MATYTLQVDIDSDQVKQLNTQGWKLCFASGVASSGGGDPDYNVVAFATVVADHVSFTWSEEYAIAGTNTEFRKEARIVTGTSVARMSFGETYTYSAKFTDGVINADPAAPKNGFVFKNRTPSAAAVLFKKINGDLAPVYISANAPLPSGDEILIPKASVAIWFGSAETSTMVSNLHGEVYKIDLTNNGSHRAEVSYNNSGWKTVSNS